MNAPTNEAELPREWQPWSTENRARFERVTEARAVVQMRRSFIRRDENAHLLRVKIAIENHNRLTAPVPPPPKSNPPLVADWLALHPAVHRVYQGFNGHPMKASEIATASKSHINTAKYAIKGLMERRLVEQVPGLKPARYIRTVAALLVGFCFLVSAFPGLSQPAFIKRAKALRDYQKSTNAPAAAFAAPVVFVQCNLKWDASPSPDVTGYRLDYYPVNNPSAVQSITLPKTTVATVMIEPTAHHFALYSLSGNDVSASASQLTAAPVEKGIVYSIKAPTLAGPWTQLGEVDRIANFKIGSAVYSHRFDRTNTWVAVN